MKYLCLIYLDEQQMGALPASEVDALNAGHLDLNDELRLSGHFIEAEALQSSTSMTTIRIRGGKTTVKDGPFAESKELVAGFYLIEAANMEEAIGIASRFPSAEMARIEIWPTRQLIVEGR